MGHYASEMEMCDESCDESEEKIKQEKVARYAKIIGKAIHSDEGSPLDVDKLATVLAEVFYELDRRSHCSPQNLHYETLK